MKAKEIVLIGALFFAGFVVTEFIIEHLMFDNPFQRFLARIILQAEIYLILYLLFAIRDAQKRIRWMEALWSREHHLRLKGRIARIIPRNGYVRKGSNGRSKAR
jgi:hypothetical protein